MLQENNARQGFVDHAEYRALHDELPEHLKDPITFLYLTGWRLSEMESLEWRDVDLAGQVIRLRSENSKNKDSREIPFDRFPKLGELLMRARTNRRLDCRFVFHHNGQPLGDFRKSWASACTKAGLVHDLRRTAVRNLVRAGIPERVAMEWTGHRARTVFERYNIVSDNDKQAVAQKLTAYLSAQSTMPTVIPFTANDRN
jgi:integrase